MQTPYDPQGCDLDALSRLDAHAAAEDQLQAEVERTDLCPACGGGGWQPVLEVNGQGIYDPVDYVPCEVCGGEQTITPSDSPKPPSDDVEAIAEAFSGKEAVKR